MTEILGYVVCARLPAPRTVHGWTYEPVSAVFGELELAQNARDYCTQKPQRVHARADGFVLCQLIPVTAAKSWPGLDEPVNARDRRVNDRLPAIVNLDDERRITA